MIDSSMRIKLPGAVSRLMEILKNSGYEAFVVGGCVRDSLMGREPDDWDICTSAKPDEMKRCFADFPAIETGLKHGTLTILMDRQPFEVTTYRIDGVYSDGRRPDQVTFTSSLKADLARRDFTINAMAYHPTTGLVDPFGGRRDLRNQQIQCVGMAVRRFQEDALRIMRAIRFASQLKFKIEEQTAHALEECLPLLDRIALERIRVELDKLLCGPGAMDTLAKYRQVIAHIIPEAAPMFDLDQKNPYHVYTVWDHTLHAVFHVKNTLTLKLAAFFHDIGKPGSMTIGEDGRGHFYRHERLSEELAKQAMRRLKYDNATRSTVANLVRNHSIVFRSDPKQARKLLAKLGEEQLRLLIELEYADVKSQNPRYAQERVANIRAFSQIVDQVLEAEQCFSLRHLALNGRDLLDMGVPQGPEIGKILKALLEQVVEGGLPNERAALECAAKAHMAAMEKTKG